MIISRPPKPLPKSRSPRTWGCPYCLGRTTLRTCPTCRVRRGTKRSSLKARCDSLARALCRDLANGKCARCGGPGSDWAHRFPRRHHAIRWSMDNCDFLCRPCHQFFTDHPWSFTYWLEEKLMVQGVQWLEQQANSPWDKDYSKVLAYLKERRAKMRAIPEKEQ